MFGLRSRTRDKTLAALALLAGSEAGCAQAVESRELAFRVGFACEADRAQSTLLRLRVLREGCRADAAMLYEASLGRGEAAPPAGGVEPGRYGIEATAYGDDDGQVAHACLEVDLPRSEVLEIELRSADCGQTLDAGVPLDAATGDDAEPLDASEDADAEEADAEPAVCSSDCSDSDPCTDDVCVAGACTNPPFTGARECDGIACTEGDMCAAGECVPGAPNDAACEDDGNPCTAEVCVEGAGCNRSNDGADGRSCDDQIGCTSPDTCSHGICAGLDTCTGSQVCSAAARQCIACTGAQDCDDNDPCTTDTCSAGQCSHSLNTASCNDGKACTTGDRCSAGTCAGTSTCPPDATCGGSTCTCNVPGETLCAASNTCVNLASTVSDCGRCGRACASGAGCQNGACKPSGAGMCTAYRSGGHDYLVCDDRLSWTAARDRCRSYGLVLAVIESQSENDFLRDRLAGAGRWIGANDRGADGSNCRTGGDEGDWHWANAARDDGLLFCTATSSGTVACSAVNDSYQNWNFGEPNNASCSCRFNACTQGQDCASIDPPNGTWDDDLCTATLGYICETP